MSNQPTTEIYDNWDVEVPSLIRNLLLKSGVFSPEDLKTASLALTAGKKFDMVQDIKKQLGFELLEPFNYLTWPVEVPGLIQKTLLSSNVGIPSELEFADIVLTGGSKKADQLRELREALGFPAYVAVKLNIPEEVAALHWKDVPLKFNSRTRKGLERYGLNTIEQVAQFLTSGSLVCPETRETLFLKQLEQFGDTSFDQIQQKVDKLCRLGLEAFRNDGLEHVDSASELLKEIFTNLEHKEVDILTSNDTLQELGTKYNNTGENIRQIRLKTLKNLPGGIEFKAEEILERCWLDDFQLVVETEVAMTRVGASSQNELKLLCEISKLDLSFDKSGDFLFRLKEAQYKHGKRSCEKLLKSNGKIVGENGLISVNFDADTFREICPRDFLALAGREKIAKHFRSQISSTKTTANGVRLGALRPSGIFDDAAQAAEIITKYSNNVVEVMDSGAIRLESTKAVRSDEIVSVLKLAERPLRNREINELCEHDWAQAPLTNQLSERFEIVSSSPEHYAHIEKLGLSLGDVKTLGEWAEKQLREKADLVEFDELFNQYKLADGLPTVENADQLASCATKHSLVKRPSSSRKVSHASSYVDNRFLVQTHPHIAEEWHPEKNEGIDLRSIRPRSNRAFWWRCSKNHEYQKSPAELTAPDVKNSCLLCAPRLSTKKIRALVKDLLPIVDSLEPSERQAISQQIGLSPATGQHGEFIKSLCSGSLPKSAMEEFVSDVPTDEEQLEEPSQDVGDSPLVVKAEDEVILDDPHAEIAEVKIVGLGEIPNEDRELTHELPGVSATQAIEVLDHSMVQSADAEVAEFLVEKAKAKIWKHAYRNAEEAFAQLRAYKTGGEYSERVKNEFLAEYEAATSLEIPGEYSFQVDGKLAMPNLMQRHVASRLQELRRFGNWSGTGAGKTLSAILATRVTNSKLTVICCPNSVVGDASNGWIGAISSIFPDSEIQAKTFEPVWKSNDSFKYLVLNYERFQQADSESKVKRFVESNDVDFIVIDEIHFAKKRSENEDEVSRRRKLVEGMIVTASDQKPDLCVLGMSATPVINELREGVSLIEMVTGLKHDDLETRPTQRNCNRLHQKIVTHGTRWKPDYKIGLKTIFAEVDCADFVADILELGKKASPLDVEKILTQARLPEIIKHLSHDRPTIIYSYFVKDIIGMIQEAVSNAGYTTGFFTGEHKEGLEDFKAGKIEVLIASSSIGTGVDGLQHCCSQLIINCLPWTNAEYEQLIGRIWRQGQRDESVKVIIPKTGAIVRGEFWSYCDSKLQRIEYKKTIADAVVDGAVPEGRIRSVAQANKDILEWLEKLNDGELQTITRNRIEVPLSDDVSEIDRRLAKYGDFSKMNGLWNRSKSETLSERLKADPEEWCNYHTLYREARKDWPVVPVEEMIRWCLNRPEGAVIGDFGCGENLLMKGIGEKHTVHAFDHVAIEPSVTACDMSAVPLDDGLLDIAIFCLSLMGANFTDYLREAHRTLKIDGKLHIWEAASRFDDVERFRNELSKLAFRTLKPTQQGQFIHIEAIKNPGAPQPVDLRFRVP